MGNNPVRRRAERRIREIAAQAEDSRTLRLSVLAELRTVLAFDAHVWVLTDPATTVGVDPVAEVPCLPELPKLIRLKYATAVNRWTGLLDAGRAAAGLHSESHGAGGVGHEWRDLLASYAVTDVASMVFADAHGCWGFLDLWRQRPGPPFGSGDLGWLLDLADDLTLGLRRCQAATFDADAQEERSDLGPVVLILDSELRVVDRTANTESWLSLLLPPPTPEQPVIPAAVYNVAAQLLAREEGVDGHESWGRTHLGGGFWITVRAGRLESSLGTPRSIAVTLEASSADERLDMFTRSCGFTSRETGIVGLLATGADTKTIASTLWLSEHTVQDHLKAIFAKTSTRSRRALMARALGPRHLRP